MASKTASPLRKGFMFQDRVALKLSLEQYIQNEEYELFLEYKKAGSFDDVILRKEDSIDAYQIKHAAHKNEIFDLDDFTKEGLKTRVYFKKFSDSWMKLKKLYPNEKLTIHLFTNRTLDGNLLRLLDDDGFFIEMFVKGKKRKESRVIREKLKTVTTLDEKNFQEFLSCFKFQINQPNIYELETYIQVNLLEYQLGLSNRSIYQQLINTVERYEIEDLGSLNDEFIDEILKDAQKRYLLPQKFEFDKNLFVERKNLQDELDKSLNEVNGDYIIVTGPPGSGKSTSLTEYFNNLKKSGNAVIKYYCFVDINDNQGNLRLEAKSLRVNLLSLIHDQFGKLLKRRFDYSEENFHDILKELGKHFGEKNQKLIIFIDGIDHAERMESRVQENLIKSLPKSIPKGIIFVLGTQELHNWGPFLQKARETSINHVKMPLFTLNETKSYLIEKKHLKVTEKQIQKIYYKTEGLPLYLRYISELIEKSEDVDLELQNIPILPEGDIKTYYEILWDEFYNDGKTRHLCGVLACLRFSITKGEIFKFQDYMNYPDFDDCYGKIKHLLRYMEPDNRIRIFHNSFREFILSKLDDSWKKDIYNDINNNLKLEVGSDLWFSYVFYYAYYSEDYDYVIDNVNRKFVDFALEKYRSDQDIDNAILWAVKSAKKKLDILALSQLGALKSRTEARLDLNLNRNLLSKVLLAMGKEEDVKNYSYSLEHNKWLVDSNTSLKLIKRLAEHGKYEIGKELFSIFRESNHGKKIDNKDFLEYVYCLGIYTKSFNEKLEYLSQITMKKGLVEPEDPFIPEYAPHLEKYLDAIVRYQPELLKKIKEDNNYFSSELISYLIIRALFLHEDKQKLKIEINEHISLYKPKSNSELAFYASYAGLSSKIVSELLGEVALPPLEGLKSNEYRPLLNKYRMIFCVLSYIDNKECIKNIENFLKTENSWCRSYLMYLLFLGECLGNHWSQREDDWFEHAINSLDMLLKINQGRGERIIWLIRDCREELEESLFLLTRAITEKFPEKLNLWFKKIESLQKSKLWTLNYGVGESIDDYTFELKIYERLALIYQSCSFIMEILKLCETKFNNSTLLKGESRSEHFMRLSLIATLCDFKNDAENWLKFAIKATLTYGYRKDTTLFQLINIMELVNDIKPQLALERCSEILELVDWIPHVSDEKNIKHLPQTIFKQVTEHDEKAALELLRIYGNNKPAWKMQDCLEIYIESLDDGDAEILWSLTSIFANYLSEDFDHPRQVINAKEHVIGLVEKSGNINDFNNYKKRLDHYIRTNITKRHWPRLTSKYWCTIDIVPTEKLDTDNDDLYKKNRALYLENNEYKINELEKKLKISFENYKKIIKKLKEENENFYDPELEYGTLQFHICENNDLSILLSIKDFLNVEHGYRDVVTYRKLGYKLIDVGKIDEGLECLEIVYKNEIYYPKKRDNDLKVIAKFDKQRAKDTLVETCYKYLTKYNGFEVPRLVAGAYYVLEDYENLNKTYLNYLNYCKELFEQLKQKSEYSWLKNYSNKNNIDKLAIHFLIDRLRTPEIDLGNRLIDTCRNLCLKKPKIAMPILMERFSASKGLIKFRLSIIINMIISENPQLLIPYSVDISKLLDSQNFQLKMMAVKTLENLMEYIEIPKYAFEKLKLTKYAYSQDFSSINQLLYIPSNEFIEFFQEVLNYLIYEKIRDCTEFIGCDFFLLLGEIEHRLKKEGWAEKECYDNLKSEKRGYTHAQGFPFIPIITKFDLKVMNIFNQILDEIIENNELENNELEGSWRILQFHDYGYKLSSIETKPSDIENLVVENKEQWLSDLDNFKEITCKSIDQEWITLFERRILSQDDKFNVPYYLESLIISNLVKKELSPSIGELNNEILSFNEIKEFDDNEFTTLNQTENLFKINKSLFDSDAKFLPILMFKFNSPLLSKYFENIMKRDNLLLNVKLKIDELLFGYPEVIFLEKEFIKKYQLDYNDLNVYDGAKIVVKYDNWQEGYEDESTSRELLSYGVRLQIHKSLLQRIFKDYKVNLCQYNLEKRLYFGHRNLPKASDSNNNVKFIIYN